MSHLQLKFRVWETHFLNNTDTHCSALKLRGRTSCYSLFFISTLSSQSASDIAPVSAPSLSCAPLLLLCSGTSYILYKIFYSHFHTSVDSPLNIRCPYDPSCWAQGVQVPHSGTATTSFHLNFQLLYLACLSSSWPGPPFHIIAISILWIHASKTRCMLLIPPFLH